jgi:hypothetical protein
MKRSLGSSDSLGALMPICRFLRRPHQLESYLLNATS